MLAEQCPEAQNRHPMEANEHWIKAADQVERGASNKRGVKCSTWSASPVSSLTKRITPVGGWKPSHPNQSGGPHLPTTAILVDKNNSNKKRRSRKKTRAISADRSWNQSIALSGRRGLQPNETRRLWAFRISVGTNLPISESMGKLKVPPPLLLHGWEARRKASVRRASEIEFPANRCLLGR